MDRIRTVVSTTPVLVMVACRRLSNCDCFEASFKQISRFRWIQPFRSASLINLAVNFFLLSLKTYVISSGGVIKLGSNNLKGSCLRFFCKSHWCNCWCWAKACRYYFYPQVQQSEHAHFFQFKTN